MIAVKVVNLIFNSIINFKWSQDNIFFNKHKTHSHVSSSSNRTLARLIQSEVPCRTVIQINLIFTKCKYESRTSTRRHCERLIKSVVVYVVVRRRVSSKVDNRGKPIRWWDELFKFNYNWTQLCLDREQWKNLGKAFFLQ